MKYRDTNENIYELIRHPHRTVVNAVANGTFRVSEQMKRLMRRSRKFTMLFVQTVLHITTVQNYI